MTTTTNLAALKAELITYIDQRINEAAPKEQSKWPQWGDTYEYSNELGGIETSLWNNTTFDHYRLAVGNVFRPGDGIKQLEALKVVKDLRDCDGCKRFAFGEDNYLFVPRKTDIIRDLSSASDYGWQGIYFATAEQREAAITKVGKQRIQAAAEWFRRGPL